MTDEQRKREQFREWADSGVRYVTDRRNDGAYISTAADDAWEGFRAGQLARDAEVQALRKALAEIVDCHVAIEEHRENGHVSRDAVNAWWGAARIARAALAGGETGETE